jgi:lysophospholipase L1-like esterase
MRKTTLLLAVIALVVAGALPAGADAHESNVHLALGDSVAAGTQQPQPFTDNSYVNNLFKRVGDDLGLTGLVNLACPGDDTFEMVDDLAAEAADPAGVGSACYGAVTAPWIGPSWGSSQLDAAVAYLMAHPGEVGLITLTVGANDVLACDTTLPPDEFSLCVAAQLGQIGANLPVIVATLQSVAPGVPIVAMNYYNPQLAYWLTGPSGQALAAASLDLTTAFNGTLEYIYGLFGVPVADVEHYFGTFRTAGRKYPVNVRLVCKYTRMCESDGMGGYVLSDWSTAPGPQPDIHPSTRGYRRIATAFIAVMEDAGIIW